jgi:hypothetical protein
MQQRLLVQEAMFNILDKLAADYEKRHKINLINVC